VRTPQQTLRMRAAARAAERQRLALSLRARYEAGATVAGGGLRGVPRSRCERLRAAQLTARNKP
jgi:hypothetical protein